MASSAESRSRGAHVQPTRRLSAEVMALERRLLQLQENESEARRAAERMADPEEHAAQIAMANCWQILAEHLEGMLAGRRGGPKANLG
jgi:hypothetical protein